LINLVQRSVTAYHIVAAIAVVVTAIAGFLIGRRLLSDRAGWIAAFAFVVIGSLPLFAGDVLNAEAPGACLIAVAVVLLVRQPAAGPWRHVAAGALAGVALLFKATFIADVVVVCTLPLWLAWAQKRRLRAEIANLALVAAGVVAVAAGAAAGLALGGSMPGFVDVLFGQDLTYLRQVGITGQLGA